MQVVYAAKRSLSQTNLTLTFYNRAEPETLMEEPPIESIRHMLYTWTV